MPSNPLFTMHAQKTQLVQRNVDGPLAATRIFNQMHDETVPLVLLPGPRDCCSCYFHVPAGVHAIVYSCGEDAYPDSLAPAGLYCCKPAWNKFCLCLICVNCFVSFQCHCWLLELYIFVFIFI